MPKISKLAFEKWEKENEDKIIEDYMFDLNEMTKVYDTETIKRIKGYWEYARSMFDNQEEEEEERSCRKCGKLSGLLEDEDICYTCAKERGIV